MTYDNHLVTLAWSDYELLDSGDGMKLERFGAFTLARPETQALWRKGRTELWEKVDAIFEFKDSKGVWQILSHVPDSWELSFGDTRLVARLTNFKHTGIFPEQSTNWEWLGDTISKLDKPRVLNLFGYTGAASVVSALSGASVTHVDASKQSLDWAHENARVSGVGEDKIRWILDDALAFVKREARRGAKYEGIVLDPPAFGRGAKGEVWKIEESLPILLESLKELLEEKTGAFVLVNGYAAGYAPRSFAQAVEGVFGTIQSAGELHIKEASSERVIPSGIYVRFVR